jgi:signal transduction histidine kinase/CheY-like chemotaxis protein
MADVNTVMDRIDGFLFKELHDRRALALSADASWRWSAIGFAVRFGLFIGVFVLFIRECRLRNIAGHAMELSEQRMSLATSVADIGVWDWNVGANTIAWDERMFQIYGLPPNPEGEAIYQDWRKQVLPTDLAETEATLLKTVAEGGRSRREFRIVRAADQVERLIESYEMAITDDNGKTTRVVGTNRDITEQREAENKIRLLNLELAQASRHKDAFLANMSHELRTPLNAILGMSEMLLEQDSGPLSPRQIKSITTISTSGTHLLDLINDILDLSKIEAGKLVLNLQRVNLEELCESSLAFVKTQAMQKHIGIDTRVDEIAGGVSADPRRIKQILVNLLTNAVKFTPEGGRIGLNVSATEGGAAVRFIVSDTGVGIAPEDQTRLFHAFTQVDSSYNRSQEGSGLGLALVAKLCELHGGSVALESEPGRGSRFIVTLPKGIRPNSGAAPTPTLPGEPNRKDYCVALIIEDDPVAGQILNNYLTQLSLKSVLHTRGDQIGEAVLRARPDIIFLDIHLPGESGWVVLTRLKESAATRHIPVVVVSVVDNPQKSLALGAAAHFTKPVTRSALAKFLQRGTTLAGNVSGTAAGQDSTGAKGPIILLAEDNAANAETLGGYLQDKGYVLRYAVNGVEAVRESRESRPAIILMDIQMPVMDGLTAMREIRADPALRSIPIVALTALAMSGDRERCFAAGAIGYMTKPLRLKEVAALVAKLAPSPSAHEERSGPPASAILPADHA